MNSRILSGIFLLYVARLGKFMLTLVRLNFPVIWCHNYEEIFS